MATSLNNSHKNQNITFIAEAFIVTALLTIVGFWIFDHAGGPLLLDELTYMRVAILHSQELSLMNRYFPIYLLMPFIWITGDPFLAVKVFWTILAMLTAVFVYITSRLLSKAIIPAVAAVVLYFAQVWIFHYPGVVWPDFTLMLLFSCIFCLYLLLPFLKKRQTLIIGVIGALLYFAIRSKESAVVLAFLFIGYGFLNGEGFQWRVFVKSLLYSAAGVLAGIIFVFFLDFVALGDAFWTVRGFFEYMHLNMSAFVERVDYNYLLLLSDGLDTFTLLILFIISGILLFKKQSAYQRVIFIFPVPYILIMTAALLRGQAVMEARYLVPVLPLMCVLGTLMIKDEAHEPARKKVIALVTIVVGLAIVFLSAYSIIKLLSHFGVDKWDMNNFFMSIFYPAGMCAFIALWFWTKKPNLVSLVLSLLFFTILVYHPLAYNYRHLETRWAATQSEFRFYPFTAFKEELAYSKQMRIFVSSNLPSGNIMNQESGMLAKSDDVNAIMYSVYFQQDASANQFVVGNMDDFLSDADQYSHAIITAEDWDAIPPSTREMLAEKFTVDRDPSGELILLKR